jgi:hypothetical protein
MNKIIDKLLSQTNIHPILIDIGASGQPPAIWKSIAKSSIYIGFDPDLREMYESNSDQFYKSFVINKAITEDSNKQKVLFYLTQSPYCSSTLKPDLQSLDNYLFADLFQVEKEASVDATTLNLVLQSLSLDKINWFKTDSQGTDLRLFNSLNTQIRNSVLAVDVEPGLIDAYLGEDLFVDTHKDMVRQGFWLSNLNVCGTARMKPSTLKQVENLSRNTHKHNIMQSAKITPSWCEARYLRTIDWLNEANSDREQYLLLWIFAIIDQQIGFATDIAFEYESKFGKDEFSQIIVQESITMIQNLSKYRTLKQKISSLIPKNIKNAIRKFISLQN